jgi:hypothetical protein
MQNDKNIHLRLPKETWNVLDQQAREAGVTCSWWIRKVLAEHIIHPTVRIDVVTFTGHGDEIGKHFEGDYK